MAAGISIGVGADTRQFSQAVAKGVVEPLDDVDKALDKLGDSKAGDKLESSVKDTGKALDSLGRDGDKAGDKLEDALRATQRETDDTETKFKSLSDVIKSESASAGRNLGDNIKRGTDEAEGGLKDFKEESASTAKESAASFDGSAESIVDAFQEVAANAFIGFGAAGLAAGLAAAAGIGLISAAIQDGVADGEAFKQKVSELTQELIDAGTNGGPSIDYLVGKLQDLASEAEDGATDLNDLRDTADKSGNDFKTLALAYAGSTDQLKQLNREGKEHLKNLQDEADGIDTTTNAGVNRYSALEKQIAAQDQYNQFLDESVKSADAAAQAEQNYIDAGGKAMETRAVAVETYQSALDESLGSFDDFKNAETNALDPAAYLAAIQARIDATSNFNSNVQDLATRFGLTDDEIQAVLDQGIDFAPMLQSIKDSGLEGEFVAKLQAAVGGGQDVLNGADLSATANVDANTDKAKSETDAFTNTKRDTTITAKADTKQAESQIRAAANANYSATIGVSADYSQAQADVDRFIRRNDGRTYTIVQNVVDRNGSPVN